MNTSNEKRRLFLSTATGFVAGAGFLGASVPFVQYWQPSAKAKAVGAPVQVDVSAIKPGNMLSVSWQGKPVFVLHRTSASIKYLLSADARKQLRDPGSAINNQPSYANNPLRSIRPEILVVIGVCTHLGCIPQIEKQPDINDFQQIYFCPCHGSMFDLAGRVFKNVPAPTNLIVPPHRYLDDSTLEIGTEINT